ncbi:MAG: hypothetical protein ACM3QX_18475 [Syntrophomonadaceae bacterium]
MLAVIFIIVVVILAYGWLCAATRDIREDQKKNNLLDRKQERICELLQRIYELEGLNAKKFPQEHYYNMKTKVQYYLREVELAKHLDVVKEAEQFMDSLSEYEKELFEYELEGLQKKIYKKQNELCSFCDGYGFISSEVEIGGRIIDGGSTCKYCNGSGKF